MTYMKRLAACAVIAVAFGIGSVGADPIPAKDIITLAPSAVLGEVCDLQVQTHLDQRINPDASRSPFVIPDGSVFVITGASVARNAFTGDSLEIRIRNVATDHSELVAFGPVPNLAGNYGVGALTLTPGVVVGQGTAICTSVATTGSIGAAGLKVRVYGYLEKVGKIEPHGPTVVR
jgi:hypothetical protein